MGLCRFVQPPTEHFLFNRVCEKSTFDFELNRKLKFSLMFPVSSLYVDEVDV